MTSAPLNTYRLYVDESGDHRNPRVPTTGTRYLGLVGVAFSRPDHDVFSEALTMLKAKHFGHTRERPVVLHREDMTNKRHAFHVLRDEARRRAWDDDLVSLIEHAPFHLFAVVLDKPSHLGKTYRRLTHPYHYCLDALCERYAKWLNGIGKRGDILAEARGAKEDRLLKSEYQRIYNVGCRYLTSAEAQAALTSKNVKLDMKGADVAGLQLADLLAHPVVRDVLLSNRKIEEIKGAYGTLLLGHIQAKYYRKPGTGTVAGFGRVYLD